MESFEAIKKMILENAARAGPEVKIETRPEDGIDCDICNNMGYILSQQDGILYSHECECMRRRRSVLLTRSSGMEDLLSRYTFESYQATDEKRSNILALAKRFASEDEGWFFIAGRSGSGKSHICSAICKELIDRGMPVYYMLWRDESAALKACVTEREEYESRIGKLKSVSVLYIDDFWKGKVTDADVNLSFELLNARYVDSKKRTILSTELPLSEITKIDEAVAGRILERSRGYCIKSPNENWRMKM